MESVVFSSEHKRYFVKLGNYVALLIKRRELRRQMSEAAFNVAPDETQESSRPSDEEVYRRIAEEIEAARSDVLRFVADAESKGIVFPLEELCREHSLSPIERDIVIILAFRDVPVADCLFVARDGADILELILDNTAEIVLHSDVLYRNSKLVERGIVKCWAKTSVFSGNYFLSEQVHRRILGHPLSEGVSENDDDDDDSPFGGPPNMPKPDDLYRLVEPTVSMKDVVLPEKVSSELAEWRSQMGRGASIAQKFGVNGGLLRGSAEILFIYGPPGTGKTLLAEAIAGDMGVKLLVAKYEQISNMWIGNTEKHFATLFDLASKKGCVLLLDECDSFLSRRVQATLPAEGSENRVKNFLLQRLESYSGALILTSNREDAIDPAFERRIALRINLPAPDAALRERIWRSFFTEKSPLAPDVDFAELGKRFAFSGGYIKNAVARALRRCAVCDAESITQTMLVEAASREFDSSLTKERSEPLGFRH